MELRAAGRPRQPPPHCAVPRPRRVTKLPVIGPLTSQRKGLLKQQSEADPKARRVAFICPPPPPHTHTHTHITPAMHTSKAYHFGGFSVDHQYACFLES